MPKTFPPRRLPFHLAYAVAVYLNNGGAVTQCKPAYRPRDIALPISASTRKTVGAFTFRAGT